MAETIKVDSVVKEKTFIGKINFPVEVPEGLARHLTIPDDVVKYAPAMGLADRDTRFIFGGLHGKWGLNIILNIPELAPKLEMSFDEIDAIIRELIKKNYAQLNDNLNLYRFWIVLLYLKGIRFKD